MAQFLKACADACINNNRTALEKSVAAAMATTLSKSPLSRENPAQHMSVLRCANRVTGFDVQ
jgi:hypothetical protein